MKKDNILNPSMWSIFPDKNILENSYLKIVRAKHHIGELNRSIEYYVASGALYVEIFNNDIDANYIDHKLVISEPVPTHLASIIGDAIQNLRSSLDIMLADFIIISGGDNKKFYFPIKRSEEELNTYIAKKRLSEIIPAQIIDLIMRFKPYKGGDNEIYEMAQLNNLDKHRGLIADFANLTWYRGGGGFILSKSLNSETVSMGGSTLREYALRNGYVPGRRLPVQMSLSFPSGLLQNRSIVEVLESLASKILVFMSEAKQIIKSIKEGPPYNMGDPAL